MQDGRAYRVYSKNFVFTIHTVHDHIYVYRIKKYAVNVHKGRVNLYNLETNMPAVELLLFYFL